MRAMWSTTLAAAVVVLAIVAPSARADDPPGLALAKKAVEELRGDEHREKMRIVWREVPDETPPEGAEVALITGYIDYELTRFVWRGGKVEASSVYSARSWFYNKKGESYRATTFDVDAKAFATAWAAARHILGARDERIEPESPRYRDESGRYGSGSHESRRWIRVRLAGAGSAVQFSDSPGMRWNWERVHAWEDIRDNAVFNVFERLIAAEQTRKEYPLASSVPSLVHEINRATPRLDLRFRGEHDLLLQVCLRVAGEAGDVAALEAVDALAKSLAELSDGDRIADECVIAATKLRLTHRWDATEAARVIRENPHEKHWQEDLAKWVRRRFRAQDPQGYTTMLLEDASGKDSGALDVKTALAELRELRPKEGAAARERLLSSEDPRKRFVAACASLDADPKDPKAVAVLLAIADDRTNQETATPNRIARCRSDAIEAAAERGLLGPADLRARLIDPRPVHAYVVTSLLESLRKAESAATDEEEKAAWRRVVDGPVELGVRYGVVALFDLNDTESCERIGAAIDRMEAALKANAPGSEDLSVSLFHRLWLSLEELRERSGSKEK